MKKIFTGISLTICASAANAATWGDFTWGAGAWGSGATPVPIDSPLALLGIAATLATAAIWYLKKQR